MVSFRSHGWLLVSGLVVLLAAAWMADSTTPASAGSPTFIQCTKVGDTFAFPGDTISFTITCNFSPPASESNPDDRVIVNDFLDLPGLTFDFNTPGSLDCPDATTEEFVEPATKQQAHCEWTTLTDGVASVQMFVDVIVEENAECGETLPNKVTGDLQTDADKDAEASTQTIVQIRILCPEDVILSIEKTPDDETISGGETATFAIEVTNSGNIDVIVRLVDQLPGAAGLDWNLVSGPPGCEPDANDLVDCTFGLPTQGPIIFSAETDDGECGEELLNEATVTFVEPDENFDLAPQQIGPILEASDTGSISVECVGGGGTPPPTGRPTPDVDVDQVPMPQAPAPQPGVGRGPSVTTGDSGLTDTETVAGWQVALLTAILSGSLFGSVLAYRRLR